MAQRPDWAWKPDAITQKAILSGNNKVRRATRSSKVETVPSTETPVTEETEVMATKKASKKAKKTAAKKGAPKKKLDGKTLAAKRKPRDSVASFIKDELQAGRKDVDKILEKAVAEFPKSKPTRGYVRWIAKGLGLSKQVAAEPKAPKAEKKAKAKAKKSKTPPKPAENPTVDPAS